MKHQIANFAEARQTLESLNDSIVCLQKFLVETESVMSAVGRFTAQTNGNTSISVARNGVPETWANRILEVFRLAGKPLRQKQAAEEYRRLAWPEYDSKELYAKVSGTIAYLHKKKGLLEKTEGGTYSLKSA